MFLLLRRLKEFSDDHFRQLKSPLDNVIILEIGYHEERGHPLTVKRLLLLEIGAPATVRRRLQRLVRLGLVHKRRVSHDRRLYQLELDAGVRAIYARYLKLMRQL